MPAPLGSIVSGLTTTTFARAFSSKPLVNDPFRGTSYTLGSAAAPAILGMILSGCSEPTPAPISGEPPPPNQKPCSTTSASPYCVHQREVLAEMQKMREEGHHTDQALFYISGGIGVVLGIGLAILVGRWRRARNSVERQEKQVQAPNDTNVRSQRMSITDFRIGE